MACTDTLNPDFDPKMLLLQVRDAPLSGPGRNPHCLAGRVRCHSPPRCPIEAEDPNSQL